MNSPDTFAPMIAVLHGTGLPIPADRARSMAQAAHETVVNYLAGVGVASPSVVDTAGMIETLWDGWRQHEGQQKPAPLLEEAVDAALASTVDTHMLVGKYFACVSHLRDRYAMPLSDTIALIGDVALIRMLAVDGGMSAARISDMLGGEVSYNAVQEILRLMNHVPVLTVEDVDRLTVTDQLTGERVFKDDPMKETFATLREVFSRVGDDGTIADGIRILHQIGFIPYLGCLHYELLSVGMYDRKPGRAVYEFSPRGRVSEHVWEWYRQHDNTQNPYLNNFKGVRDIDMAWVDNRFGRGGATVEGAVALVHIFDHVGRLPYPSRRYAAQVLRGWLLRRLDALNATSPQPLPLPSLQARANLLRHVMAGETRTHGIADQRIADLIAVTALSGKGGVFHGIGSSVNETNRSASKFGDIEWMDAKSATIRGYEAHGGLLDDKYVDAHQATLYRTLERRKDDLESIAPANQWDIAVTFIDHGNQPLRQHRNGERIDLGNGFQVIFHYTTYHDAIIQLGGPQELAGNVDLYDQLVHQPLSGPSARPFVREAYDRLLK